MKHLYIILFTDNIAKVGCTKNLPARISNHRSHATAMGQSIKSVWVTPHKLDKYVDAESLMISDFSNKFHQLTNEFFRVKNEIDLMNAIKCLPEYFINCASVSSKGENLVIEINLGNQGAGLKDAGSLSSSVLNAIIASGPDGIGIGLLRGKRRKISSYQMDEVIKQLINDGSVKKIKKSHTGNKTDYDCYISTGNLAG